MGRAYARLGQQAETYAAISEVQRLAAPMKRPKRPEHHFRYDPDKAVAYTATTLAWVGDVAAEEYAREIIRRSHLAGHHVRARRAIEPVARCRSRERSRSQRVGGSF